MSVITLGIPSGLVIDCGYAETVVLPVSRFVYIFVVHCNWISVRFSSISVYSLCVDVVS